MRLKIILSFILIIFLFPSLSYADVIEPGTKEVKISYQITNTGEYPDYIFLINGNPSPSLEIVNSNPFTFYKLSTVSIYALPKSSFNGDEINSMNQDQLDNFYKNNPNLIKSNVVLQGSSKTVNINNPLDKMLITLHIDSINKSMDIKKSKVIYTYNDGSNDEESFTHQNSTPEPSKNSTSWWNSDLFYIIIPLLALLFLILIIVYYRQKK